MNKERFRLAFRENVRRRSRTAKGSDKGSLTSSSKLPLLLQGEALAARTAENVERLVDDVWRERLGLDEGRYPRVMAPELLPDALRWHCERWYDIASDGLVDDAGYAERFDELERDAARVAAFYPVGTTANRRYRLWTPGYTTLKVPPILLERHMDEFYSSFAGMLRAAAARRFPPGPENDPEGRDLARIMAYADVMLDGEVHPWLDGCSRVATAAVMWIAASFGTVPPLFAPTKPEHYETIRDIDRHERYILGCVDRFLGSSA